MRCALVLMLLGVTSCAVVGADRLPAGASAGGPESTCQSACRARVRGCDERQCDRGCSFVFDRFAENEGDRVLACVAAHPGTCDDKTWAHCATRIGPYADGGPPAPPPPNDVEPEDEGD